ncbi:hypothetical protein O9K51_03133 [Purpureocillium lavendulum]|uniref:Uncharacterized protein n=1 Tax=Purpureocillium lavendulum TaxID=1247861 RepID=A0AB34G232_9HYPO|nr:hypothetical protein O9K51_03133 [Purpureocillium lavendulum]
MVKMKFNSVILIASAGLAFARPSASGQCLENPADGDRPQDLMNDPYDFRSVNDFVAAMPGNSSFGGCAPNIGAKTLSCRLVMKPTCFEGFDWLPKSDFFEECNLKDGLISDEIECGLISEADIEECNKERYASFEKCRKNGIDFNDCDDRAQKGWKKCVGLPDAGTKNTA